MATGVSPLQKTEFVLDEKLSPGNIKSNRKKFIRIWLSRRSHCTTDLDSNAITVTLIHFKCHCFKMPLVERASGQPLHQCKSA